MIRKIKNFWHLLEAIFGSIVFGFPGKKLTIIGVTGTDGKTTTANLIHHILTTAGFKTCISSTLSGLHTTTPGRWRIQKFLRASLNNGCTHAVLEVSSHAIDQNRIWGVDFTVGVITNIADHEHLDYHKTFENYRKVKLSFLESCKKQADWRELGNFNFKTKLIGDFNHENCLAAIAVARELGINDEIIRQAVASFEPPPGRLEIVVRKPFLVIVDFAHTPQAFEKVLPEIKKLGKRLIHVFGCTGDRDRTKRPIMGAIAEKFDDQIILTHEDTYSEDPRKIIEEIAKGIKMPVLKIMDRKEAIKLALEQARPGDVVIITGVGHQKTLNMGGKEIPWSDQKVVKELLND
ncbi:MAG: UDP-N-acetylmuramoyl-L-alanyl-D-glutamate--2,6-diaminopimelate ligase [Patescibacteria group bacterium]